MRVAVVGANLLGSASAFYVRRALTANRAARSSASSPSPTSSDDSDEIIVFDRLPRAGGHKYLTLRLDHIAAPAGSAADMDVRASPALAALLSDAALPLPPPRPSPRQWTIFDWEKDDYKLGQVRSRLCAAVSRSFFLSALLQLFALLPAGLFATRFADRGFLNTFIHLGRRRHPTVELLRIFWFALIVLLGAGLIPIRWVLRVYDWIFFRVAVHVTGGMTYGGHSLSVLGDLVTQMKEHVELILERDAASSCITLGHLLSACGMGKYAKVSVTEFVGKFQIQQSALDDCVSPGLAQTYGNTACSAGAGTNTLAVFLNMLSRCPFPVGFRAGGRFFDAEQTDELCPHLLKAADADLRLGVDVRSVTKISKDQYELMGTDAGSAKNVVSLGEFDAVILAAVVDPSSFNTNVTDHPVEQLLAYPTVSEKPAHEKHVLNTARYVSLVKGELKPEFFKKSDVSGIATHVTVLNSVNCSEVLHVADDVYRVSSWEKADEGASLLSTVFKDASKVVSLERFRCAHNPSPIRNISGAGAPEFVLGTRFLNAACVDRIANDPNLDVLSARNTGSFFRDGVATWK